MSMQASIPANPTSSQVRRWSLEIRKAADEFCLDRHLVAAICVQESGGIYVLPDGSCNPAAIRPEPRFWQTYQAGIRRWIEGSPQPHDNRWYQYEDLYSCSYGLMQVMYQTALEHGFTGKFPTELCIPEVGLYYGCKILAHHRNKTAGPPSNAPMTAALLRYNGGGDTFYPTKIMRIQRELEADRGLDL